MCTQLGEHNNDSVFRICADISPIPQSLSEVGIKISYQRACMQNSSQLEKTEKCCIMP